MEITTIPASQAKNFKSEAFEFIKQQGLTPIVINDAYLPAFNSKERFKILYGGSGSGKSDFKATELLLRCLTDPFRRILFARKHKVQVRDSQFLLLKDLIKRYGLDDYFVVKESEMDIRCYNGNELLSAGLDDVDKLKSIPDITDVWIEEPLDRMGSITVGDFTELDRRVRTEKASNHIHLTFNPINRMNWIHKLFFEEKIYPAAILKTTYLDNHFLPASEVEKYNRLKLIDENEYNVYALGNWGTIKTGREFYGNFSAIQHTAPVQIKRDLPIHLSFDQNVIPYISCSCWQIEYVGDVLEIRCFDEVCLEPPRNLTEAQCQEILTRFDWPQAAFIYGDASGNNRGTRSPETDYDIVKRVLRKWMLNNSDRVQRSNPGLDQRRAFIAKVLGGEYKVRVIIDPKCERLIEDLQYTKQDINGRKDKERGRDQFGQSIEKRGHMSDTFDYLIVMLLENDFLRYLKRF